jgi:hypothetical protein
MQTNESQRMISKCQETVSYGIVDHVRDRDRVEIITEKRVGDSLDTSGSGDGSPLVTQLSRECGAAGAGCYGPVPEWVTPVASCGNVLVSSGTSGESLRSLLYMLVKLLL